MIKHKYLNFWQATSLPKVIFLRILKTVLLILFSNYNSIAKVNILIRLTQNDCGYCYNYVSLLNHIKTNFPIKYILPEEFKDDGIEVYKNFYNLDLNINNTIFSDSIYYSLSNDNFTMIFFLEDDKIKYKFSLKELPSNEYKIKNFYLLNKLYQEDTIFFSQKLPHSFQVTSDNEQICVKDNYNNIITIYDHNGKKHHEFKLNDSIIQLLYSSKFKNGFEEYEKIKELKRTIKITGINSKINSVRFKDGIIEAMIVNFTYTVKGIIDTNIFPFFSILRCDQNQKFEILNINPFIDSTYFISEINEFYSKNDTFYFGVVKQTSSLSETNFVTGIWTLKGNQLLFTKFLPPVLPKYNIDNNFGYNMVTYRYNYPYLYFNLSGEIYNFETTLRNKLNSEIQNVDFIDYVTQKKKLNFMLNEISYNSEHISAIFQKNQSYYLGIFDRTKYTLLEEKMLLNSDELNKLRILPIFFKNKIGYFPKSCNCLILK